MYVCVLLLAFTLNLVSLARSERFHPDEAFYMTFARNAAVNGAWGLPGALDKPPLTLYWNAMALKLFAVDMDANGVLFLDAHKGEFAARIAGVFVGVVGTAVLMRLAYTLYRSKKQAIIAGCLWALSPYLLAFSPTAFTDMPMLILSLGSLLLAARQRPVWCGIFFVFAFAAKPQAIFFVPLIFVFQQVNTSAGQPINRSALFFWLMPSLHKKRVFVGTRRAVSLRKIIFEQTLIFFIHWLLPVFIGAFLLGLWDTLRPETSVFVLGAINNGHETLISSLLTISVRLGVFLQDARWLLGDAITTGGLVFLAVAGALTRKNNLDWWLLVWLMGYGALHIISTLNLYDRYWLLMLPTLVLLATRPLSFTWQKHHINGLGTSRLFSALYGLLLMSLLFLTLTPMPIGSDKGRYTGIDELAAYLNAKPVATVIYDRWLGWQLGYYMGQWTDKRRVYFPTPDTFQAGVLALDEMGTRYFIAPRWEKITPWLSAVNATGFALSFEKTIADFVVYAVVPKHSP